MALETRWERRLVERAAAIVTVSEPWAESFRMKYAGKPVMTVLNGFDPDDYHADQAGSAAAGPLSTVYTGSLYPGRRAPPPPFAALRRPPHPRDHRDAL